LRDEFSFIRNDDNLRHVIMSEPNKTKLKDGSDAFQYQYDYLMGSTSEPYREFNLVTLKDGSEYAFVYVTSQAAFNRYLPIVKSMIETFQPLGSTFG
jgi:hypothetical protein